MVNFIFDSAVALFCSGIIAGIIIGVIVIGIATRDLKEDEENSLVKKINKATLKMSDIKEKVKRDLEKSFNDEIDDQIRRNWGGY